MTYSAEKLDAELIRDEGLVTGRAYRCTAGKLTVGVGHNLDANPLTPDQEKRLGITNAQAREKGLTRSQAIMLLHDDIRECEGQLDKALPWWRELDDTRQRVMLNMCFNMGIGTLLTFKNTLRLIETHQFEMAATGMRASKWASQVKGRADRLANMMRVGGLA